MRLSLYLLLGALMMFGCETIVGIEDVNFVKKDASGDDDDATTDASTPTTCKVTDIIQCSGGTQPEGQLCNDKVGSGTCTCAAGLQCVFGEVAQVRIGHCCPPNVACGEKGDPCQKACDCRGGICQSGACQ